MKFEIDKQVRQVASEQVVEPDGIKRTLGTIHAEVGVFMAGEVNRQVRRQANIKATPREIWERVIRIYFEQYGLTELANEISATTVSDINRIIFENQLTGRPITEIMGFIENLGYSSIRAERIARTEIAKSSGTGSMVGALSTGLETVKEWISARDARTRRLPKDQFDHFHMDGRKANVDGFFQVPSKLGVPEQALYPGDPNLSAGNVINCRCTTGYEVVRGASGRPQRIQSPPMGQAGVIYQILQSQNAIA